MIAPLLLSLVAANASGYVVSTVGEVRADGVQVSLGQALLPQMHLSTGDQGWAELWMSDHTRFYVGAGSQISIWKGKLHLERGRIWVLHSEAASTALDVSDDSQSILLEPGSSAVVERINRRGFRVAQERGQSRFGDRVVKAGHVGRREPGSPKVHIVSGGRGLFELVAAERRTALRDPSGLLGFLRQQATAGSFAPPDTKEKSLPTLEKGRAVEDTLRPPPFFEAEVPPRGPNVQVRVTYEE